MISLNSAFGKLNLMDLLKGFILVVFTSLLTGLLDILNGGAIEFTWAFFMPICKVAAITGIGYLLKQLITNSDGLPMVKEK